MKQDETICVRIPGEFKDALELERKRMSRRAGAEVKMSAVIRAIFARALRPAMKSARKAA